MTEDQEAELEVDIAEFRRIAKYFKGRGGRVRKDSPHPTYRKIAKEAKIFADALDYRLRRSRKYAKIHSRS